MRHNIPSSVAAIYERKLTQGITISSIANPTLNATYPIDDLAIISVLARDVVAGLPLPNDAPTFDIVDITGTLHAFTALDLVEFYKAMRDLHATLNHQRKVALTGGTVAWPDQTAVIL